MPCVSVLALKRQKEAAYRLRAERRKKKLCQYCGKAPAEPFKASCRRCLDRVKAWVKKRSDDRKAAGLCRCGRPRSNKKKRGGKPYECCDLCVTHAREKARTVKRLEQDRRLLRALRAS